MPIILFCCQMITSAAQNLPVSTNEMAVNKMPLHTYTEGLLVHKPFRFGLLNIKTLTHALQNLLLKVANFVYQRNQVVKPESFKCDHHSHHHVLKPVLWIIVLQNNKRALCFADKHLHWATWTVRQAHINLSTEVFVQDLQLYCMQQNRCKYNLTFSCQKPQNCWNDNALCGIYTKMLFYHPGYVVQMKLFHLPMFGFACSLRFSTVSALLKATTVLCEFIYERNEESVQTRMHFLHSVNQASWLTYWIIAQKQSAISIGLTAIQRVVLCEGPGMAICFLRFRRNIMTQTFQAVVYVQTVILENHRSLFTYNNIDLNRRHQKLRFKDAEQSLQLDVNCSHLSLHPCMKIYSISNQMDVTFNVSVTKYQYEGSNGTDCLYGGLAIVAKRLLMKLPFQTLTTICTLPGQVLLPNVYSSNHRLVIVGYAYPHFSRLYAQVNVSATHCHEMQINICKLQWCKTFFYPKTANPKICVPDTWFKIPGSKGLYSKALKVHVKNNEPCKVVQLVNTQYFDTDVSFSNQECLLFLSFYKVLIKSDNILYDIQIEGFLTSLWNYGFGEETRLAQSVIVSGKKFFHNKETDSAFVWTDTQGKPVEPWIPFKEMFYKLTMRARSMRQTRDKFLGFTATEPQILVHTSRMRSVHTKFLLKFRKIYPDDDTSPLLQVALFGLGSWINILLKPRAIANMVGLIGMYILCPA